MSERLLRELIEEATRDIPADVLRPPLERIRRRARLRRIVWPVSISALLSGLLVATGLALVPTQPGPDPDPSIPLFAWSHAYATDGGRDLTIYLYRPGRCGAFLGARTTIDETDSAVTLTVTGEVVQREDCSTVPNHIVNVRLDRPLGDRMLRDGARDLGRPVFWQELLPVIPGGAGGWWQVSSRQNFDEGDPAEWHAQYTKPGGPDVSIDLYIKGTGPQQVRTAIDTVRLGTRDRTLYPRTGTFELRWEDGACVYVVGLSPSEGYALTESQFRAIVGGFTWP